MPSKAAKRTKRGLGPTGKDPYGVKRKLMPKFVVDAYVDKMAKSNYTKASIYEGVKRTRYQAEEEYTQAIKKARSKTGGRGQSGGLSSTAKQLGASLKQNLDAYSKVLKRMEVEGKRKEKSIDKYDEMKRMHKRT